MTEVDPIVAIRMKMNGETKEEKETRDLHKRLAVAKNIADKLESSLKPKGFFNIPKLLDDRRIEYAIPNGAFSIYPSFDRVYIYQIPVKERDTFTSGGSILMPDDQRAYDKNTAPRGILISAGLKAMDTLYSTGYQIGHIVRFKKFSPFIVTVDEIDGHNLTVMVVRDGDLEGSEDMAEQINSGRGRIVNVSEDGYDFRYELDGFVSGKKQAEYYDPSI
jgi:hypothetical protein